MADDSKASDVGARYAQALFDLAVETDSVGVIESDLSALAAMLKSSADLRKLLASPAFTADDKAKGLAAVRDRAKLSATTGKFLGLVAANRRTAALPAIIDAYKALVERRQGVVLAKVTSAVPLNKTQTTNLTGALRAALGKDPRIETHVDPSILGGIKVRVGSRLYDASLKSKLDSLKFALKRA